MKKIIQFSALAVLSLQMQAQQSLKKLQLDEAVLGQWRQFYPKATPSLQWFGDAKQANILYRSSDGKSYLIKDIKKQKESKLFNLEELNAALSVKVNSLPRIVWTDKSTFNFLDYQSKKYVRVQYKKGTLKELGRFNLPEAAEHLSDYHQAVHYSSKQVCYNSKGDLYLQKTDGNVAVIEKENSPFIISGEAIARSEFGISEGIFWADNGKSIAFYQKNEQDVKTYPLLDLSTTPAKTKQIKYPMAGQKSEYPQVGIHHIKNNRTIYISPRTGVDHYLTNVAWGSDAKYLYIAEVNREQNKMQLNKYKAADGSFVKTLFEETHEKYVEPENPPLFIDELKGELLWMSERDGFMHVYRYTTDGKLLNQVTKGKWVCQKILGYNAKKKALIVQGTDESGLNTNAYLAPIDGKGEITAIAKVKGQHKFTLSPDKKYLLDKYNNLETPNKECIIDLEGEVVMDIFTAENPYKNHQIATTEFLTLKAKDGTPLHGRMIKPSNFDPSKKYPVLVYVYGGPHAQMVKNGWLGGASLWMHYAAERGYLIFTLDNRGSSNRGLEFENIIHRRLGDIEMEDQLVGVDYLKSLPYVNANELAVHGWSFGGFMTSSLMLRHPGVFQVGVAGGPVTDWKFYEIMYGERYMDSPNENPEGYEKNRLKNYVKNLEGKLLLIHGTVDDVVVLQHNLDLVQAFVREGVQVDYFPYPMHKHNVYGTDRVHLIQKVLDYVDDQLLLKRVRAK